jgi:hypothetical protein
LCIFDISDPTTIIPKAFTSTNLNSPNAVVVKGDFAYVASTNNNRLCIFNISDPDNIVARGFTSSSLGSPFSLGVEGNYACVASVANSTLSVFDISDPDNIILKGSSNANLQSPECLFVKGNYVYLGSTNNTRLCVFDLQKEKNLVMTPDGPLALPLQWRNSGPHLWNPAGNVGIRNNQPNAPLAFSNTTGEKISLYESSPFSQYGFGVQPAQLQIYSNANTSRISFGYFNSGIFTEKMYLDNNTGILNVNGTAYPSDERFKKEITAISQPIKKIMALRGVNYFLRADEFPHMHFDKTAQTGLLAQDVEKVFPSAVHTLNEKGYKGVDYARLVPLLVEGIKEQQREIDELKKLVQKLTQK